MIKKIVEMVKEEEKEEGIICCLGDKYLEVMICKGEGEEGKQDSC